MITKDDLRYWDNEENSLIDRYTVVWPNGDYVGMGIYPFHPQGFCQHGCGAEYEPDCFDRSGNLWSHLGKMIEFEDLPDDCKLVILRDLETI